MRSVADLFVASCERGGDRAALRTWTHQGWVARSWSDWLRAARCVAASLADLGVAPGDRVALVSRARRESAKVAMGAFLSGAVLAPLPSRVDDETFDRMLRETSAAVAVVDDPFAAERLFASPSSRSLRRIVVFDARASARRPDARGRTELRLGDVVPVAESARVMRWTELLAAGGRLLDRAGGLALPRDPPPDATLARVYTAGRGGAARAVRVTHANALAAVDALNAALPESDDDEQLATAPLSGAFGVSALLATLQRGVSTSYADPTADPRVALQRANPTILVTGPRLLERVRDEALAEVASRSRVERAAWERAFDAGARVALARRGGRAPGLALSAQHRAARALALDAVRARFGERMRFAVSTGAPTAPGVVAWFDACGVTVLEGYGFAEAAGLTHLNTPDARRPGSVGRALRGVETKVVDGEVLVRADALSPDAPRDAEGWFRTGDEGRVDAEGYLYVTGRRGAATRAAR